MKKSTLIFILTYLIALTSCLNSFANGPLVVKNGKSITYGTRPFLYRYDKGNLGKLSNTDAITLIESLYKDWEAVKTAMINFQRDSVGSLDIDVTASNFDPILNSNDLLGYTPVIFDTDGSLLNAFLGQGAGNSVLGLSGPITVNSGPLANQIAESQAIFNGRFINGIDTSSDPETSLDSFMGTIIHETGHGIGLDHAQINVESIKPGSSQALRDSVPLMFPVAVNDLYLIREDDASGISFLYPNSSELTKFGSIEGKIFRQDGVTPVLGANVIARNINDPTLQAISCISDFLTDGSGSYKLFAVPPGSYKIEIEPVDLSFTGGSGVGPYTTSKTDKSFQNPVPKGFYTGSNQPITQDPNNALVVTVAAGQAVKDTNIIASQVASSSSTSSSTSGSSTSTTSSSSTSTSGSPSNINETEPNDTVNSPQPITIPVTVSGNSTKGDSGEVELTSDNGSMLVVNDLFQFSVDQTDSINALLSNNSTSSDSDIDLLLFNSDATEIIDSSSQTGNTDELISSTLQPGTYLLGVGAFSGSSDYTLAVSQLGGAPSLSISGPESYVLSELGMNMFSIQVNAINFLSKANCKVKRTGNVKLTIRPTTFMLTPTMTSKKIVAKIPNLQALKLIASEIEEPVTITVTCSNGAQEEFDILITPTFDNISKTQKRKWQYSRVR